MKLSLAIISSFIFIFLIGLSSASIEDLGTVKQGDCVTLQQSCANCTYNNITSVLYPDMTTALSSNIMTASGTQFTYNFCNTSSMSGSYIVNGFGDPDGAKSIWIYTFEVTPSGQSGSSNIVFFIFIIVLLYAITFIGFFGKNIPITILGGMAMIGLGVYMVNNGVIIYRDWMTNYLSYITIGLGATLSLWALIEMIQETF